MPARVLPSVDDLVDAGFLVVLGAFGLVGFTTAFGGVGPITVGLAGIILGIACAFLTLRMRFGTFALTVVGVVAFFLLGGLVAVRATTLAGLPTASTVAALADGAVNGWARLVTSVPPTGSSGNLLVVPFICGLLCGLTGFALARRFGVSWLPVLPPASVLAVSILLGTMQPANLLLQGAGFCLVVVLWIAVRGHRESTVVQGVSRMSRIAGALGMLVLVAVGAVGLGPYLPFADAHDRVVLREYVEPPFDPHAFRSPLLRMRRYVSTDKDKVLFTATGLPEGARIRLATMDYFDGTVWNVAGGNARQSGASGFFERVGDTIPPADGEQAPAGTPASVTFTVGDYADIWMPSAGPATSVGFAGSNSASLAESFRYNRETAQGVVTSGLRKGDTITQDVIVPPVVAPGSLDGKARGSATQPDLVDVPASIKDKLSGVLGEAQNDGARAMAIGTSLRENGYFSQGQPGQGQSLPGHSSHRLSDFLAGEVLLGDAEQYAATAALMARQVQLPTRVVMGWVPTSKGTFSATGKDVTAWIEVMLDGLGWVPVDVTPDHDRLYTPQTAKPKPQPQPQPDSQAPPETKVDLAPPVVAPADEVSDEKTDDPAAGQGLLARLLMIAAIVGVPVLLVMLPVLAIIWAKSRRRRRRQHQQDVARRIAGGWDEVIDRARDRGDAVGPNATRMETAAQLGAGSALLLADRADGACFSDIEPSEEEAARFWALVAEVNASASAALSRWQRLRAAVSLRSLRATDPKPTRAASEPRRGSRRPGTGR